MERATAMVSGQKAEPDRALDQMERRLTDLQQHAVVNRDRITEIADRIFGQRPTQPAATGTGGLTAVHSGNLGSIANRLGDLGGVLQEQSEQLDRLSSL